MVADLWGAFINQIFETTELEFESVLSFKPENGLNTTSSTDSLFW